MKKIITTTLILSSIFLFGQEKIDEINLYPDIVVESEKYNANGESVLIDNIQVVDVKTGKITTKDVLVTNKKIAKISKSIKPETSYKVIDASGKWMIPGLIDSHIHLFQSGGLYTRPDVANLKQFKDYEDERTWLKRYTTDFLKRYLRCGITTVIDVGGPIYNFDLRDKYADISEYPNIFITGPLVSTYQPKAFEIENAPIIKANTPEEARELVRKQIPLKPDFIKIWYIARSKKDEEKNYQIVKATIDEAHKNNLKVAVHATELSTAKKAIKAGANFLVHSVEDEKIDDEFIKMVKDNNVSYIPTLIVMKNYIKSFSQNIAPSKEDFNISNPTVLGSLYDSKKLEMKSLKHWERWKSYANNNKVKLENDEKLMAYNLKKAIDNGFNVATGTDAGNIGTLHATSLFDEMIAMKKAGLTNLQVLQTSTINGAKILDKQKELGSIEEGKLADLVILNENPLENLEAVKAIDFVIKGGTAFPVYGIIKDTPEQLVQRQVNGYNAGDIDAFLEPYSDDFEIYDYPNKLKGKGKANFKGGYAKLFKTYPNLHCEIVKRMVLGNKVIDYERITGISDKPIEAIAIYEIKNGKISKVTFVN
ncbi:amidohydrolase family protein [Tenacibaculum sp. MEBiC06402]|uniref:amidohydrolase family protein n=1 Tax=unclassified Tenacibaculum TaxID=2635139 RepID=UPI003B997CAE